MSMMIEKPLIDPERMPLFTAVGFTIALLALVVAVVAVYRIEVVAGGTQLEVLTLNQKIENLHKQPAAPAAQKEAASAPTTVTPASK